MRALLVTAYTFAAFWALFCLAVVYVTLFEVSKSESPKALVAAVMLMLGAGPALGVYLVHRWLRRREVRQLAASAASKATTPGAQKVATASDQARPADAAPALSTPTFDRSLPAAASLLPTRGFGLPAEVLFDYRDTEGRQRQRRVMARQVLERNGVLYLEGICTQARASRTFRMDRILGDLTHADTGELAPPSSFAWLAQPAAAEQVTPPRQVARRATYQTAVFFAGFSEKRRNELSDLAEGADMQVRASITKTVNYVVAGSMFGERQRDQAEALGIPVIDEHTFRAMT